MRVRTFLAGSVATFLLVGSVGTSAVAAGDGSAPETTGTLVLTQSTTLTADHAGNVRIVADDVTLDCAGHTVHGPGIVAPGAEGFNGGIDFAYLHDVTIRNCVVTGFQYNGIYGYGSADVFIEDNTISRNAAHGIHLEAAMDATIVGNTAQDNGTANPACGFIFTQSAGLTINSNVAIGHEWAGFLLGQGTSGVTMTHNTGSANGIGFVVEHSDGNRLVANTANRNSHGFSLLGSVGTILTGNTANLNEWIGFQLDSGSSSSVLSGNTANGNNDGFNLLGCDWNTLTGNIANTNHSYGFLVWTGSGYNTLTYDTGLNNGKFDAVDDETGTGNIWWMNTFRTTSGL